ncbi:hypothetical protein HU746_19785 [Pseudomonas lurida]|jgi:hypothetical protein|uniref:SSU ribosomal protein S2p (SAe) n=1 Tax=Pseudomonas fluorescens TaxID=294 RepID=A0A5E6QRH1_PSEFL|nr:hypothetical protein [Pseudomonas lurida]MBC3246891.1 hypothetical protein [Pseudomonas lurida]MBC3925628.1 hypothetical protein [Pseudomonas lurida]VVM12850.1 hypothetical protein PS683_01140 [Pseudomonas fluorescens]VVM57809.1 hypothetical protein PS683_01140 [Pseudomonas fluorescens]
MAQSYINERATDYHSLKSRMMGNTLSRPRSDHFDVLNRHLRPGLVAPGQLVIIPDSHRVSCSVEEAWLMRHAEEVRRHLELNAAAGTAMIANYDLLQSFMANASIGVGSATSAWARHLDEVAQTLEETARLHQRLKDGGLDRAAFVQHRQALFRRLEVQLQGAARFGTGLQGNESLKKVLGLSTKSYLHKGEIAGYAMRMREIAQMSKWLGKGTYVGLALDVGVAGLEIKEACVEGREAQCRRAKYVETGRLAGGVSGAALLGRLGAGAARRACTMFLGIRMKGKGELACGIIGGSAGGYVGGDGVGSAGAFLGGEIMEVDGDLIFLPEGA